MWVTVALFHVSDHESVFFGSSNVCRVKVHTGVDGGEGNDMKRGKKREESCRIVNAAGSHDWRLWPNVSLIFHTSHPLPLSLVLPSPPSRSSHHHLLRPTHLSP